MEEKILSILLEMQGDISDLKTTVGIMQNDIKNLKESQDRMQATQEKMQKAQDRMQKAQDKMQKAQDRMQKAQDRMNVEIHEIRFELAGMKSVQEEILDKLRISNLNQGQILEKLSKLEEENAKENKEFDTRIKRLEAKAV